MARTHTPATFYRTYRPIVTHLLPDDGLVDEVAIDVAARGLRPVALTQEERRLAARRMLDAGEAAETIRRRLRMGAGAIAAIRHAVDATPPAA